MRLSRRPTRIEGFVPILSGAYWRTWSKTARQDRKKWLTEVAGQTHRIRTATFTEYEQAYRVSSVAKRTHGDSIFLATRLEVASPECMTYWVAEQLSDNAIKAGIAVMNSHTTKNTYYVAGFHHTDSRNDPLMIGLIDEWFRTAQQQGQTFLHMGRFWQPGESSSWKGFSIFKAKFGVIFVAYPPLLGRFVRGSLF